MCKKNGKMPLTKTKKFGQKHPTTICIITMIECEKIEYKNYMHDMGLTVKVSISSTLYSQILRWYFGAKNYRSGWEFTKLLKQICKIFLNCLKYFRE